MVDGGCFVRTIEILYIYFVIVLVLFSVLNKTMIKTYSNFEDLIRGGSSLLSVVQVL